MINVKVNRAENGFVLVISWKKNMRIHTKRYIAHTLGLAFQGELEEKLGTKFAHFPNTRAFVALARHHGGYVETLWFRGTQLGDLFKSHKSVVTDLAQSFQPDVAKLINEALALGAR